MTSNTKIAIYPARILPAKGQHELLPLAMKIRDRGIDVVVVVMGGSSPIEFGSYAEDLRAEIKLRDLEQQFIFVDQAQPRERVRDGLAAADLMVFPSQTEAMPLSVLEANAMKVPVVAYASGGLKEVIENGKTGVLVPIHEEVTLADRVLELLANDSLRIEMGLAARSYVLEKYSLQVLSHLHHHLYSNLSRQDRPVPVHEAL